MSRRTNDDQTYTNPRILIELMENTLREVGASEINDRKYKALREGWIAAMYSKAVSKVTGKLMYLRPNPLDILPDYFGFRVVDGEDEYKVGENFEIEVFEWSDKSHDDLFNALKKKIEKYSAPKTIFVCSAHKSAQIINLPELSRKIIELKPDISELSLIIKFQGEPSRILVKLFPEPGMLFIPNSFAKVFYPKYDFAKKLRGKENIDAGRVKINSMMEITELPAKNHIIESYQKRLK